MSGGADDVPVLCAVRGGAEAAVATALGTGRGTSLARRCADVAELLAGAAAGLGAVAVVSGDLPGLDREAVAGLRAVGCRVVALVDADAWERERVEALGVDRCVPVADASDGARLVEHVLDALRGEPAPAVALPAPPPALLRDGHVVAVWGPTGAPGRTTLAVNVAAELAGVGGGRGRRRGGPPSREVLVADADTYGGTVAQVLGLLDESAGLAAAARAASQGVLDAVALARLSPYVAPGLRVLTGVTRAARWAELPGPALDAVWAQARRVADVTVVDCGFCLETDELLTYDTRAPQRNAATLSALAAADVVVVVGAGDPVGVQRLVRALGDLDAVVVGAPRVVVANRVRASASGPQPAEAVRDVLARYAGVADAHVVPDDPPACDRALLEGRALAECAPSSAVRGAVTALAARVAGLLPVPPATAPVPAGGPPPAAWAGAAR